MTLEDRNNPHARAGFEGLSEHERDVVGSADDYDWNAATAVPARSRPEMTQFSVRLERDIYDALQAIADREGVRLSDIARAALRDFSSGATTTRSGPIVSVGRVRVMVQVKGQTAQFPSSRRLQSPDEVPAIEGSGFTLATT